MIDLSNLGALVEGPARLLPGTHVDVHIITAEGRTLVRSRVVRAYVCHLEPDLVRYRGGLAFERSVDTHCVGYGTPAVLPPADPALGSVYSAGDQATAPSMEARLSA